MTTNPRLYNYAKLTLEALENGLGPEEINVKESLTMLDRTNEKARNSDWYIFYIQDTWAVRTEEGDNGYGLYQLVGSKMVSKLSIGNLWRTASYSGVMDFLNEKKIKRIFTTNIPSEGRWGLENTLDDDGDEFRYEKLTSEDIKFFKEDGIGLIVLDS